MSIFSRRSAEVAQPLGGTVLSLSRLLGHQAYDTDPIRTDADALKAYSGWVYACVSTISQDVRSSTWNVWQKAGTGREDWKALEEGQVPDVLARPNSSQTFADLLELTQVHLDLAGRAFWHLVTAGPGGRVVGIQPLNPDWVSKAVYNDARTQLTGWEIAVGGSGRRTLPAEDVILFRYPDPVDPVGGMSPIRAVAMSADMDTYSRAYAASHLRNHAQPTGILTTESELTRDQASTLAEAWKDSHQGTNNIQVLGKGAQYQPLSSTIRDLAYLELSRVSRDQILAAYHVPASKLGLVEDSSRANGEESDRTYSALCLGPRLRRYHEPITQRVLPRLGLDSSRFCFEFDPVEVADKTFERDAAQAAFQAGAITLDEYRDRIGFGPDPNGRGAVYFVPLGFSVVEEPDSSSLAVSSDSLEEDSAVLQDAARGEAGLGDSVAPDLVLNGAQVASLVSVVEAMMAGTLPYPSALEIVQSAFGMSEEKARRILGPETNAGINEPQAVSEAVDRAMRSLELDDRELEDPSEERIEIAALRFLSSQGEAERRMKGRLRAFFSRMQKAVLAELKSSPPRAASPAETRAPMPSLEDVLLEFDEDLKAILFEESFSTFGEGFESFSQELASTISPDLHVDFNLVSDEVIEWAARESAKKVKGITAETLGTVQEIVSSSLAEGDSIDGIADKLRAKFDEYKGVRAETIARTETANAYNAGKFENARAFDEANDDLVVTKTWVPTQDDRTRDAHRSGAIKNSSGQTARTLPINEAFYVGGEPMQRPLDDNDGRTSAGNVIRCRCVLINDVRDV